MREFNLLICQLVLILETICPSASLHSTSTESGYRGENCFGFFEQVHFLLMPHSTRSRLSDRQRQRQIGGDRVARDAPLETLESLERSEEQMASCGGTERDMDRVRRYLHEHCLDERLRLREALVVARLLGALRLDWPGSARSLTNKYSILH